MNLSTLGYNNFFDDFRRENGLEDFEAGRVIAEHKERYILKTADKEYEAEVIGNLRFTATSRADFPAVGDWVAFSEFDDSKAIIHKVYTRKTIIQRQAVGSKGEKQIIATNIDCGMIVQAIDRDFNINRAERYLAICLEAGVSPAIILTKTDLIDQSSLAALKEDIHKRLDGIPVFSLSNETGDGLDELKAFIEPGKTYCLLGSSGVGKSSLLNNLMEEEIMKTGSISDSTAKGRHVTSHRELRVIKSGGIIIDNPGMREVGLTDMDSGIEKAFDKITELANDCRYADCRHVNESGCAVIEAVEQGLLDENAYQNYLKMEREKEHFESTVAERRSKDKSFGKMVKDVKRTMKKNNL